MIEQRTEEWHAARLGVITGTRAHKLLSGPATRKTLMAELIREIATASAKEFTATEAMDDGIALEPAAVAAYEERTGHVVIGSESYVVSSLHPRLAYSPDGLILCPDEGFDHTVGVFEAKCRQFEAHIYKKLYGLKPEEKSQCEFGMFVTGAEWCDYFGYCPSLPASLRENLVHIPRDPKRMSQIGEIAFSFLADLDGNLEHLGLSL